MKANPFKCLLLLILCLPLAANPLFAQTKTETGGYEPDVGQIGKDVVWVPTAQTLADRMLRLAGVTAQDYVIDLGSGDGRIVITAAKLGARALGIEYNPDLVAFARRNAAQEGVGDRARFVQGDIFESDFSRATVITMFLLPELNLRLRPMILSLAPGTRIVSNTFDMGEWTADRKLALGPNEGCHESYCDALLWIVPARVGGRWRMPQGELILTQDFQKVSGTLETIEGIRSIENGRLVGDRITFAVDDARYAGRVKDRAIRGTLTKNGNTAVWTAIFLP